MPSKLKAFVKYSSADKIVPGVLIRRKKMPSGPGWYQVPESICCSQVTLPDFFRTHGNLKAFIKYDKKGNIVSSSTILRSKKPKKGKWVEIPYRQCCVYTTTSTSTSTSTTSTTTSTTTEAA